MLYSIERIVADWRARQGIDRTADALEGFHDLETLTLSEYVESHVESVVNEVELMAEATTLEGLQPLPEEIFSDGSGGGWIDLPADYRRLVRVRLQEWHRGVEREMTEVELEREVSEFIGVRASIRRPKCRVSRRSHGPVLELYPATESSVMAEGVYLPARKLTDGAIFISERCYPQVLAALPPIPKII